VSQTSRSILGALRLTLRAQPRSAKFRLGHHQESGNAKILNPESGNRAGFVPLRRDQWPASHPVKEAVKCRPNDLSSAQLLIQFHL
jgi:hypothetical protein